VKGFIVENNTPGFTVEKIHHKMALRVVQNGLITLQTAAFRKRPAAERRILPRYARVLRMTRGFVAWEAVGCSMGAYENALAYAQTREQFGKPIASFQLVSGSAGEDDRQYHSVAMPRGALSQMQDEGKLADEHASLAKAFCTVKMRETVDLPGNC